MTEDAPVLDPAEPDPAEQALTTDEVDHQALTTDGVDEALPGVVVVPDTGYTAAGVPTLEGVREKIEGRFGTALGATELAEETPEGRTAAQQFEERQKAAADKLAQIRASMEKPEQT